MSSDEPCGSAVCHELKAENAHLREQIAALEARNKHLEKQLQEQSEKLPYVISQLRSAVNHCQLMHDPNVQTDQQKMKNQKTEIKSLKQSATERDEQYSRLRDENERLAKKVKRLEQTEPDASDNDA